MSDDREDRIRKRAHALWEQNGRPEGQHEEHWHQASQEADDLCLTLGQSRRSIEPRSG